MLKAPFGLMLVFGQFWDETVCKRASIQVIKVIFTLLSNNIFVLNNKLPVINYSLVPVVNQAAVSKQFN